MPTTTEYKSFPFSVKGWFPLRSIGEIGSGVSIRFKKDKVEEIDTYSAERILGISGLDKLVVEEDRIKIQSIPPRSPAGISSYLEAGDIVLRSTYTIGSEYQAAVVGNSAVGAIAGDNMVVFRISKALEGQVLPIYIAGMLRSAVFKERLGTCIKQYGDTWRVVVRDLRNLMIPIPSTSDQQAFVDAFLAMEKYIEESQKLIAKRQSATINAPLQCLLETE